MLHCALLLGGALAVCGMVTPPSSVDWSLKGVVPPVVDQRSGGSAAAQVVTEQASALATIASGGQITRLNGPLFGKCSACTGFLSCFFKVMLVLLLLQLAVLLLVLLLLLLLLCSC